MTDDSCTIGPFQVRDLSESWGEVAYRTKCIKGVLSRVRVKATLCPSNQLPLSDCTSDSVQHRPSDRQKPTSSWTGALLSSVMGSIPSSVFIGDTPSRFTKVGSEVVKHSHSKELWYHNY